jgi:integrase
VSSTVEEAVAAFLEDCRAVGLAEGTIRGRESTLGMLARSCGRIQVRKLGRPELVTFFNEMAWSPRTRYERIGQLKTFFAWCRGSGLMPPDSDPFFQWRRVVPAEATRTRIPFEEWATLLGACRTVRERSVIATGLFLFLRASEQKELRVKDVHLDRDEIDIFRVKTGKRDAMPIVSELRPYLADQLEYTSSLFAISPEHYLIPAGTVPKKREPNGRLIAGSAHIDPTNPIGHPHRVVQSVLKRCGYETAGEGEHTLRRSGARAYFDSLVDMGYDGALRRIQVMLGHKNSITTELYLGLDVERYARNRDLRGKPMFASRATPANVIPFGRRDTRAN